MDLQATIQKITELAIEYTPKVLLALITLWVGLKVIKLFTKITHKALEKNKVDASLTGFLESFLGIGLKILLLVSVASMLGVETASFLTMIGAASLAVGLSLQGSLANLAGGVLILLFKPFQVGDLIDAQGYLGHVRKIQIFSTHLTTLDNKKVIIPNGILSNGTIKNISGEDKLRVDLTISISYNDDIDKAKQTILEIAKQNSKILQSPAPFVAVENLGSSSVDLTVRLWTQNQNYWDVYFQSLEDIKKTFDQKGLNFPYPTQEIILQK